jgi:hypothetical protein
MASKQSKSKKSIQLGDASSPKTPRYLGAPNLSNLHIGWRFSHADINGPYTCGGFTFSDFQLLWDRLRSFEKMNFAQLQDAGSLHDHPTIQISKDAKDRLQGMRLDDIDTLYSFHIQGDLRLWCMKYENLLCILWWDRNHRVYPVPKKHT